MWRVILTDKSYVPVGEVLDAKALAAAFPLSKLATGNFQIRLDHPLADTAAACDGFIKLYYGSSLRLFGPVISAEESATANDGTMSVNFVDAGWFLQKRLVGKSGSGTVISALTPRHSIVSSLLSTLNAENETGIQIASGGSSGSSVTYVAGPYRPMLETLTELGGTLDGFEWRILPVDNFSGGAVTGPKIGSLVMQSVIGSHKHEAQFEFGTGRHNIAEYKRRTTRDGQANRIYHLHPTQAAASVVTSTGTALDIDSISDYKLLEDLAQADLIDTTMRQTLVDEHAATRRYPRKVIEFKPHADVDVLGRLPLFGTDYDLGDEVHARAAWAGRLRFDAIMRVWGYSMIRDDNGRDDVTLVLEEEG